MPPCGIAAALALLKHAEAVDGVLGSSTGSLQP